MTKKLLITTIIITLIFTLGVLFLPFINLNLAVFKNQPGTNRNTIVITKFDLFKPRLSILIPNGNEGYLVSIADYERENIFFFKEIGLNGKPKPIDERGLNARIESQDINIAKSLTSKYDLTVVNPDGKLVTNGIRPEQSNDEKKLEDAEKPDNFYFDYINTKDTTQNKSKLLINNFFSLKTSNTRLDILNMGIHGDLGTSYPSTDTATQLPETNFNISNQKVNFVAVGFNKINSKADDIEPEAKVAKIVLVMKDRSFVEVPVKPDGTFDFEAVRSKWE